MSVASQNRRGTQEIRTLAGMSAEKKLPHQAYLRIACLEMEKFRRGQERQCAMRRVQSINARCAEISSEQAALMAKVAPAAGASRKPADPAKDRPQAAETPAGSDTNGFRIRY